MNIKLYKKYPVQSAIALGGKHHWLKKKISFLTHCLEKKTIVPELFQ